MVYLSTLSKSPSVSISTLILFPVWYNFFASPLSIVNFFYPCFKFQLPSSRSHAWPTTLHNDTKPMFSCLPLQKPILERQMLMWEKNGLFKSQQTEKMGDSHPKDHLDNCTWAGGFVRRKEEGKKIEQINWKEDVESSPLRGLHASHHSLFR